MRFVSIRWYMGVQTERLAQGQGRVFCSLYISIVGSLFLVENALTLRS